MISTFLVHATGLAALGLNIRGMLTRHDGQLRTTTGVAAVLWVLNNLLIGAETAAMLSVIAAGRQASSVATERRPRLQVWTCASYIALNIAAAIVTWDGLPSIATGVAAAMVTYAMFFLAGAKLRLVMFAGAFLWGYNAVVFDSWEQILANVLSAAAAAMGAWRTRHSQASITRASVTMRGTATSCTSIGTRSTICASKAPATVNGTAPSRASAWNSRS